MRAVAAASGPAARRRGRRREPDARAGGELHSVQTTGRWAVAVGHRKVRLRVVAPGTPLNAAEDAPLAGAILPEDLALLVGIHRVADARLVADYDHLAAARHRRQ